MAHAARSKGNWQGYPPSDEAALSQAESTAQGNVSVPATGGRSRGGSRLKGVPDAYETGTDTVGRGSGPPLASDNASFASGVKGGVQAEPHPSRTRMSAGESAGARLTVSPSMKTPQESPVPTQGGGYPVPSTPSRSGSFSAGQQGAYGG
jgi:hypothetical protein